MLTREQYNYGAADNASEKVKALFRLRNSTRSLIIQCLADREIQKEKYDKSGEQTTEQQNGAGEQSGAYGYNSGVIHNPHVWCKMEAVTGHGWDESMKKPLNRNLWFGRVLHSKEDNSAINANQEAILSSGNPTEIVEQLLRENTNLQKELSSEKQRRAAAEQNRYADQPQGCCIIM